MNSRFADAARDWLAEDPDPDTRAELAALLEADDETELAERFGSRLEFGTAGLRGPLGAGPNRMNRVVVQQAAAGLGAYLRGSGGHTVVIGYDARHKSALFARDTARVMSGCGLTALLLPRPLPTPVLAFAVRHLSASAGVMVTASHNPPRDNGYKVYLDGGAQLAPPAEAEISAAIAAVGPLSSVPVRDDWRYLDDAIVESYLSAVATLPVLQRVDAREIRIVYTPLHGVGRDVVVAAFNRAGFATPQVVSAQAEPDPDFPTVAVPNPEEPGTLDLATAAGSAASADLVIANDPDADRCAVAVPTGSKGWRVLRGDELGILLADFLLRNGIRGRFATTLVSSSLLTELATSYRVPYSETLTGFKWIARAGADLVFGYEEAFGYCVAPQLVRDKDGVSAALLVAAMAAAELRGGSSLLHRLDEIASRYGVFLTDQLSLEVADTAQAAAMLAQLRAESPVMLGALPVHSVEALSAGVGGLPPTPGLRYRLGAAASGARGARIVIRPSGTEPKLKAYLEVVLSVSSPGSLPAAKSAAQHLLDGIRIDLCSLLRRQAG